jgi:hypothetical protein
MMEASKFVELIKGIGCSISKIKKIKNKKSKRAAHIVVQRGEILWRSELS